MPVEKFAVKDRESWLKMREQDVTASVAAALFGPTHPYMTALNLYCLKTGIIEVDTTEDRMIRRGRLLEAPAIQMLKEERPTWAITKGDTYYREVESRIGATPDTIVVRPDIEGFGTVQIKTVGKFAFDEWLDEHREIQVPLWIMVQVTIEASLMGANWASIAPMVINGNGGLDMPIIDIPIRPKLMVKLRGLVAEFWRRVEARDAYPPDYNNDQKLIAKLYADAEEGSEVDLSDHIDAKRLVELTDRRFQLKQIEQAARDAEKERKVIDAELINAMQNHERAKLADGTLISAPTTHRKGYEVKPTQFRSVTIKVQGHGAKNVDTIKTLDSIEAGLAGADTGKGGKRTAAAKRTQSPASPDDNRGPF